MARFQGRQMGAYVLVRDQVGHEDPPLTPADTSIRLRVPDIHDTDIEYSIIDLYAVGPESHDHKWLPFLSYNCGKCHKSCVYKSTLFMRCRSGYFIRYVGGFH